MEAHINLFSDTNSSKSLVDLQQNKPAATKRVVLLGMLFVTFLVVSNLTAFKVAEIHLTDHYARLLPFTYQHLLSGIQIPITAPVLMPWYLLGRYAFLSHL